MDQALIDQIVSNVLAQLQPAPSRPVDEAAKPQPKAGVELTVAVITADLLADSVVAGQSLRIGKRSIITPSARDWLNTNKVTWSRIGSDSTSTGSAAGKNAARWQLIVQTVTPNVRALRDALQRQPDGWKLELVGQPLEAATLAASSISTADRDGVVVLSEYAEIIACRTNRNEKVRAAVIADRKQLELTRQHLGVNLVCVNPNGRTFVELKNLLRDCATSKPTVPAGWSKN